MIEDAYTQFKAKLDKSNNIRLNTLYINRINKLNEEIQSNIEYLQNNLKNITDISSLLSIIPRLQNNSDKSKLALYILLNTEVGYDRERN